MALPRPLAFLFATMFLDAFGLGFIIPNLPDVIRRFGGDEADSDRWFGLMISVYAGMQFVASPILGAISDRFGRRPVLLVSLLMAGLDYVLMAFAPTLTLLFVGRIISGLTGASMTVANSYIGDTSTDEDRAGRFGLLGAAWGAGFVAGPVIGGMLGGAYGVAAPFLAAAVLNLVNFGFGLVALPESLPRESRRPVDLRSLNPLRSLLGSIRLAPGLMAAYAVYCLSFQAYPSLWTLYTERKFGWTAVDVGVSLGFLGVLIAVVQGWATKGIVARVGERRAAILGVAWSAVGFAMFAGASRGWMMYAILGLTSLSLVAGPALQSLLTREAPPEAQGELQGSLVSINALTEIVGPLGYTALFSLAGRSGSPPGRLGLPFLAASAIGAIGVAVLIRVRDRVPGPTEAVAVAE